MASPTQTTREARIPEAPRSIQKGSSLADLLGPEAIACLAHNIALAQPGFDVAGFQATALRGLNPLSVLQRGQHLQRQWLIRHAVRYHAKKGLPAALRLRQQAS